MPELPEVETTCNGIRPHLENQTILKTSIFQSQLRWPISEEIEQLTNSKVLSVTRRAKYILIQLPHGTTILHLGMSGSLRICSPEIELKKHDHLIFHLSSGMELRYHDPRRFGSVLWIEGDEASHPLLDNLGPEPLSDDFDGELLFKRSRKRSQAVKTFILDSKVVVAEALFLLR